MKDIHNHNHKIFKIVTS